MSPADKEPPSSYLAVCQSNGSVGIAVYYRASAELLVAQASDGVSEAGSRQFETMSETIQSVQPDRIYISSCAPRELSSHLHRLEDRGKAARAMGAMLTSVYDWDSASVHNESEGGHSDWVHILLSSSFRFDKALQLLLQLRTPQLSAADAKNRMLQLSTCLDPNCKQQVRAAGALLRALLKDGVLEEDKAGRISMQTVGELSLSRALQIDALSMRALHIFHADNQPSLMGIGTSKAGFSIFSMMDRTVTTMGRKLLRRWFLEPLTDLVVLRERQETIAFFIQEREAREQLAALLKKVSNPVVLMKRMLPSVGVPSSSDLRCLTKTLSVLQHIGHYLQELYDASAAPTGPVNARTTHTSQAGGVRTASTTASGLPAAPSEAAASLPSSAGREVPEICFRPLKIADSIACFSDERLQQGFALIEAVFDLESESSSANIKPGLDGGEDLDRLKETQDNLQTYLDDVAANEIGRIPLLLARLYSDLRLSCHFSPHVGYLMFHAGGKLPGELLEDCFPDYYEFSSEMDINGEQGTFYQSGITRQLDSAVGNTANRIRDVEDGIAKQLLLQLSTLISDVCLQVVEAVATFDVHLSLAEASEAHLFCRPTLTRNNELLIDKGWHPLSAAIVPTFIPNNTSFRVDTDRLLVITGPNCSGKSILAKQVAIITFLAHIGCYVPAERATVGMTDRIMTRILNEDNNVAMSSTFAQDLTVMSAMLNRATDRSLLIIDEFGKGTLPMDGKALLMAALSYFASQACPPKIVCTTHFLDVHRLELLPWNRNILRMTMTALVDETHGQESDQPGGGITFLYKLKSGSTCPSFGVDCLARAEVPARVISRMREVQQCLANRTIVPARAITAKVVGQCTDAAQQLDQLPAGCVPADVDRVISRFEDAVIGLNVAKQAGQPSRDTL